MVVGGEAGGKKRGKEENAMSVCCSEVGGAEVDDVCPRTGFSTSTREIHILERPQKKRGYIST